MTTSRVIRTKEWLWSFTKRTPQPVVYSTLITGTFSDDLEYIITDWEWNAIFVYDYTWYPIISTIWTEERQI